MGFPFPITPFALMPKIALLDGYSAAHYAQKLPQSLVKGFVILVGFAMTIVFFWRGYR
jgi:hypothetical protein